MSDNNFSLKVSTGEVRNIGKYFTSSVSTLNEKLSDLSNCMSTLSDSWVDKDGESYVSKFSSFIENAKKINDEIDRLGRYATYMADNYESILKSHLDRM